MSLSKLLLYIGLAILAFWVLGLVLKLAALVIELALIIGLVLVIAALLHQYYESHKKS